MRCVVCDSDKWKNVDQYRHAKKGMSICEFCGFVSYPHLYRSEEEIRNHYRTEYRPAPTIDNLYSGHRKLNYHAKHLAQIFALWKDEGKTEPEVFEVGAAMGMVLDWIRRSVPGAKVGGSELTTSFKRVAHWQYGITLVDDIDLSKKYDLIISYKVAEHQMDVDKRLREYAEALTPNGYLYISVPTWFKRMTNFGLQGFDIEYYYDTNHINVWTQRLFESLLKKAGLKICYYDGETYDDTYICKRDDSLMSLDRIYEDVQEVEERMASIKKAVICYEQGDIAGALKAFPNFPDAWVAKYESERAHAHKHAQKVSFDDVRKNFIEPMMDATGAGFDAHRFAGDLGLRYDQFSYAAEVLGKCDSMRPGRGQILLAISQCYREMAKREPDIRQKAKLFGNATGLCAAAAKLDLQARPEATNWIYFDQAQMPIS
jgi:SAM-dependent methyltransferase